ncbi:hypothetical protein ACGF12_30285 [Kitasatospora sp. NPDC048296]|uniref:hypothetical protein n=1 Tax=Kitasatospora sp. NPDC048296 TaxID=3364048 RepID=UPI00371D6F9D
MTIDPDRSDFDAFLTSQEFATSLQGVGAGTLWQLRTLLLAEEDRRSVRYMHEALREEFGWLYGEADASGVRITSIEVPSVLWDAGWHWGAVEAVIVFSDGSRLTEDLEPLIHDHLCDLAGNTPPYGPGDVYTLVVPPR